jgi:chromosome segregation ATPase
LIFILAFAVGAAPIEFVRAVWRALGQTGPDIADTLRNSRPVNWVLGEVVREFKPPDWGSKRPLTALEDVNIWDEGRLYLEGVQNVHALATADLVRVVLNTPFDAQQLVDWVDQALLYIHAKDLWRSGLAAVGIRTATDLFDYCLKPKKEGGADKLSQSEPDEDKLRKLAGAFNAAQLMVLGTGDPRYEAFNAGSALETAAEDLEKQYTAVKELSDSLDKEKEASLDNIVALRENVNAITEEKVNAAQDARAPVHAALTAAGETGDDDELLKAWEDGGTIDEKLTALAEPRQKASEAIEEKDNNEYKLTREKLGSSDETEKKAAQGVLEEAKKQVAALSSAVTEAKEAIQTAKENIAKKYKDDQANTFAEKANALQSAVDELVTKVTEANDLAGTLTKDNAKEKATGKEVTNAEDLQNKLAAAQEARKTAEEAAGTLETAVDGVESLKATVKPKVTALKGQLGTLKDTIEAAVTEVQKVQDASAPTDNDIKSAKEKVTAVFDAVDPEKDGSAKKAMKEITDFYNPTDATNLKNSAEKANALESAVDELVTKVTEANDLAVKLTKENAGEKPEGKEVTNVEDLKSKLDAAETARETAKGAADTLETAVESLGSLKATVKPKVTALKEQLGEQQDKLKARIEGAVNQVQQVVQKVKAGQLLNDTDISGVKDKVTAVYNAVVPEQDGSAEKAMKEIADFFAAYNMYKSGAPMAKAKEAVAAIEALETLGTAANNVAKDLKADDKKTWDNVLGLQGKLEELQKQVETVEEKRKDVSKKLEALKDQETYAVAQARRAIDAVSVTDATDKVKAAKTELEGQSADKTDKLEDGKKKVTEAVTALEKLKKETDSAAKEAISASLPLQLTEDILAIMLAAMKRDPNIVHVCRFWDERMTEAKAAT